MENNEVLNNEESGISFDELFTLVKKNIVMILLITILFTLAGAIYGLKYKETTYTANGSAVILVGQGDSTNEYQNVLIAQYMLTTFQDYMSSGAVITNVVNSDACKGYNLNVSSVINSLSIDTLSVNSLVLNVKYKSNNKEQAIKVLNQILDSTYELSNSEKYKDTLGNKFIILDYASDFNTEGSRGAAIVILITCAIGIIISFAIIILKYILDDTYTSKEAFEKQLNINVISCLPLINDEKGGE